MGLGRERGLGSLDEDGSCVFGGTGDVSNQDPKLGALANNCGPTKIHALLSGSPAIDAGNAAAPDSGGTACQSNDQRGEARLEDGDNNGAAICDTGAFELADAPPPPPPPAPGRRRHDDDAY